MLDVLAAAALRTLLLAAAVQFGLWLLRVRRAHLLLVTWTVVLAASLAMPALQWATPLRLPIDLGGPAAWLGGAAGQRQAATAVSGLIAAADAPDLPAVGFWLGGAYLGVSGVMMLRLAVGVALSLRLLANAKPAGLASAPGVRIRISPAVAAPVTVGSVILLPPDVMDWPPATRQAAIAHECAHVARGDFVMLALSQFNRALFWFSPVPWLLHRRLAALAELASDDHAMRVTDNRTGYAEALLEMGRRSGPVLRGVAMARASMLQHRIERVLSNRVAPAPASLFQRLMTAVGAAAAAVAAASPDFNPAAPPGPAEAGRSGPVLALSDSLAPGRVQPADALPQPAPMRPRIEDAFQPSPPAAAPPPRGIRAALPQPSGMLVTRPVLRPVAGTPHPWPPVRAVPVHSRAIDIDGSAVTHMGIKAAGLRQSPSGVIRDAGYSGTPVAGGVSHAPAAQREGHPPPAEPSLLKAIDQQTCDGVYLPGPVGGPTSNGWAPLNLVRAKFFQETDGRSWLKFTLGVRDPVNLPVTVTGKEVEFTAANNTSFKMLPQGANHLTGTTQRPYGTIDFACGKGGA